MSQSHVEGRVAGRRNYRTKALKTSGSWADLRVAEGVYCVHSQDVLNDRKSDGEGESPTEGGCGV